MSDFDRDGYVVIRDVVPQAALEGARASCATAVEHFAQTWLAEGLITDTCADAPFETRYAKLREQHPAQFPDTWRRILASRPIYDLWRLPEILGPVRELIGDEVVAHGVWNGRPREPNREVQRIPWHQDAHYYPMWSADDGRLVTCWIPLVPVDARSGCLQVVPGSHAGGYLEPVRSNGQLTVADSDVVGEPFTAEMAPGDILLFDALTLHRSVDNVSDYVRWSLDIRFGQATPAIQTKRLQGYTCYSASDPSAVEPFETWIASYSRRRGFRAWIASYSRRRGFRAAARILGVSPSELQAW
jgi:hypothetical protein